MSLQVLENEQCIMRSCIASSALWPTDFALLDLTNHEAHELNSTSFNLRFTCVSSSIIETPTSSMSNLLLSPRKSSKEFTRESRQWNLMSEFNDCRIQLHFWKLMRVLPQSKSLCSNLDDIFLRPIDLPPKPQPHSQHSILIILSSPQEFRSLTSKNLRAKCFQSSPSNYTSISILLLENLVLSCRKTITKR